MDMERVQMRHRPLRKAYVYGNDPHAATTLTTVQLSSMAQEHVPG